MESLDYWRLGEDLSIAHAALLVIGEDPSGDYAEIESYALHARPVGYEAAKHAIAAAISRRSIEGAILPEYRADSDGNNSRAIPGSIDPYKSNLDVESLRAWPTANWRSEEVVMITKRMGRASEAPNMNVDYTTAPVIECAKRHADLGFKLVAWHGVDSVRKYPEGKKSWGLEPLDPSSLNGEDMLGLNHGLSHTVVVDGDELEHTRRVFNELGLNVDAMPGDPPSYRGKPAGLNWHHSHPYFDGKKRRPPSPPWDGFLMKGSTEGSAHGRESTRITGLRRSSGEREAGARQSRLLLYSETQF